MYDINEILKILNSYNINSHKYGPTIYANNNNLGICLDIKDSNFGFLTRAFTFKDTNALEEFLKKHAWYKKNKDTYNIELALDSYNTKEPHIKYLYHEKDLSLDEMLNLQNTIEEKENKIIEDENRVYYLANIKSLTDYLIELKKISQQNKVEKNSLKIKENNLKFDLLQRLTTYYGRVSTIEKKGVSLENIMSNNDIELLENNCINIEKKRTPEVKQYLNSLIDITKQVELDDKNLINIYSNSIYRYNIEILEKQINFVNSKIESEKNFNIKGSKIHNIDEELKSFLKNNPTPTKIEDFLQNNKNKIYAKYNNIKDIKDAYSIISGKPLNVVITSKKANTTTYSKKAIIDNLKANFDSLPKETQAHLVLYNSFYKSICNYIIDNKYPPIEKLKTAIDFNYYYKRFEEVLFNENNSHYLINYFKDINLESLDSYIASIIEISKNIEKTHFNLIGNLKAFCLDENSNYKTLTINPIFNNVNMVYLIDLNITNKVLFIPEKIELDDETKELTTIITNNIYLKGNIIDTDSTIIVHKYNKINEKYNNSDIIITKDLTLNNEGIFHLGTIEGELANG